MVMSILRKTIWMMNEIWVTQKHHHQTDANQDQSTGKIVNIAIAREVKKSCKTAS